MPATLRWIQLLTVDAEHFESLLSFPVHCTPLNTIGPEPRSNSKCAYAFTSELKDLSEF